MAILAIITALLNSGLIPDAEKALMALIGQIKGSGKTDEEIQAATAAQLDDNAKLLLAEKLRVAAEIAAQGGS